MKVLQFTDRDGNKFYTAERVTDTIVGATIRELNYTCQIDVLEMTEVEYFAIPATNLSAKLFVKDHHE